MNNQLNYNNLIEQEVSSSSAFIESNTIAVKLEEIEQRHIVPSYTKDYEPLISVADFINSTKEVVHHFLHGEEILAPAIRVSHPIKGRIPQARFKPVSDLEEHEKTLYYERTMFVFEVPTITTTINNQPMNLMVGGIKAYHEDKINGRKGALEHFKIFVGFQVKVCANMCIWTEGTHLRVQVRSLGALMDSIMQLLSTYHPDNHIHYLHRLNDMELTQPQFAQFIGRARMHSYLSPEQKKHLPAWLYTDSQALQITKDYFQDEHFGSMSSGSISLWNLYNLMTNANKSSYIDLFANRALNAMQMVGSIQQALEHKKSHWFLS